MGTLSRGQTFGATESVTSTKLHNLVDLGSITNIVNADISASAAISDTKLADITTGGKVRGSALLNLASIPSGAGQIPYIAGTNHKLIESTTEVTSVYQSQVPQKLKEIRVGRPGAVSVTFEFCSSVSSSYEAYVKIYKNGNAVGTLQITTSSSYITSSAETISGLAENDLLQLYAWVNGNNQCKIRNFTLKVEAGLSTITLE